MARQRKSEKAAGNKEVDVIDLGQTAGLTLMTDSTANYVADRLPTLMPSLDHILGGGIPFGRVTEIFGMQASGKSTLAVHLTKMAQRFGVMAIWADVEGTLDADSLEQLGADPSKIFVIQPKEGETMTIEMVTEKVKETIATFGGAGVPAMIIWDSLASTPAAAQMKDGFNPNMPGVVAKAIANMTTQIGQSINQNNIAFVILNQAREDFNANAFLGPQIKSTGGKAMEHWGTLRLEVVKASQLKLKVADLASGKEKDQYIGHIFRVKTKKSKVSTPNRQAEVFLISDPYIGFDFTENVYRSATEQYGLISKGAWRAYITDDGEEIKLRDGDWVPFLNSDKGKPVLFELFHKELLTYFPEGFSPLDNDNINVNDDELFKGLKEYYAKKEKAEKEQAKADAKTAAEAEARVKAVEAKASKETK